MNLDKLVNDFSNSLATGSGTIFVGSGISVPSRLPTWSELLTPFAEAIGLQLNSNDDLPQIAQFIVNENGQNRGPLIQVIKEHLTGSYAVNSYHESLQKTNLRTIWTTNYDTLLEDAFRGFVLDVKAHDDAISRSVSSHQIEIIKIHGCTATSKVDDLVLTLQDFEDFFIKRSATAERLKTDLLKNSFLFIGYNYGDPNIKNIIVEARRLSYQATRQHYMIQKAEDEPSRAKRQEYWVKDLRRVGIACTLIDDYRKLNTALHNIALKSRGRTVFVTGGHVQHLPEASEYGKALADIEGLVLLDGQSEGIGREVISAFTEVCLKSRHDIRTRIRLFPNPYAIKPEFNNDPALLPDLKKWRAPLLREAHVVIVFHGSMGTQTEVDVAKEMGCFIVPVPQQDGDLPSKLIEDREIRKKLEEWVPSYLSNATRKSVTPPILKQCVLELL